MKHKAWIKKWLRTLLTWPREHLIHLSSSTCKDAKLKQAWMIMEARMVDDIWSIWLDEVAGLLLFHVDKSGCHFVCKPLLKGSELYDVPDGCKWHEWEKHKSQSMECCEPGIRLYAYACTEPCARQKVVSCSRGAISIQPSGGHRVLCARALISCHTTICGL